MKSKRRDVESPFRSDIEIPNDLIFELLQQAPPDVVQNLCSTNRSARQLCSMNIWKDKFKRDGIMDIAKNQQHTLYEYIKIWSAQQQVEKFLDPLWNPKKYIIQHTREYHYFKPILFTYDVDLFNPFFIFPKEIEFWYNDDKEIEVTIRLYSTQIDFIDEYDEVFFYLTGLVYLGLDLNDYKRQPMK